MLPVDLTGIALDINTGAPLVVLQERAEPHRVLPIFVGPPEATAIALAAAGQRVPQPLVHDVMAAIVAGLDGHVDAIEVNGLRDGAFTAAIKLTGPAGSCRIGSRPSDAVALAVRTGAPMFVSEAVLDVAGRVPDLGEAVAESPLIQQLDDEAIDAEIDSFRTFLDDLDPSDFVGDASDADTTPNTSVEPDTSTDQLDTPSNPVDPDDTANSQDDA